VQLRASILKQEVDTQGRDYSWEALIEQSRAINT